ncbi:MBL fold metallo-hydrolase [Rhodohalobacter sp. SW132]|uniref:MBL fold metallo-hydrolase RNA specificity domain-containing protein n=1 Tax=Rhodohalobacter sp. SW132 TaxID=2293433 RepID=UPI000E274F27|nr:MBL fold metallo-hydrolase [Rhodohalobacter sp. SW132]REL39027.1 MBL fold metallo-hydrolase [Rhodohalobacter sp. SW132]
MSFSANIHFLGASGTVTGSKYLLELPNKKILIDCGMFQGIKELRELNWQQLPVNAADIDIVLLTHGHADHIGFLPRLVNMGFRGPVWVTAPTLNIAEIILHDSAKIQEEDAERANKDGFTKHKPAKPLYNLLDVEKTLPLFRPKPEGEWITIDDQINIRFQYSGHIIGATFIELEISGKRIVFSGDVGRSADPLLFDPKKPDKADVLVLESTYGDRLHSENSVSEKLLSIIEETVRKNGTLIIPSFAVERAQLLIYLIWRLHKEGKLPGSLPVILDSPMGIDAYSVFRKYHDWHKLDEDTCMEISRRIHMVQSYRETWEIIENPEPKIIIAGSGMVTGGRVLSYLKVYLKKQETTVLLAGYQAEGTRGRQLLDGAKEIKFFGKMHRVNAKIEMLQGLSGHADQQELTEWVSGLKNRPQAVYLVHGEQEARRALKTILTNTYGWDVKTPNLFEIEELEV